MGTVRRCLLLDITAQTSGAHLSCVPPPWPAACTARGLNDPAFPLASTSMSWGAFVRWSPLRLPAPALLPHFLAHRGEEGAHHDGH